MTKICPGWLPYCLPLAITALFAATVQTNTVLWFIPALLILNFLNKPSGEFKSSELAEVLSVFENCEVIRFIKFTSAFLLLGFNFWMLYMISVSQFDALSLILISLSMAIVNCTFTMALGHELLHLRTKLSRPLANALLFTVCLPFFTNDHLFGHHKYAGSERDLSSAPKGLSFYRYLPAVVLYRIRKSFFSRGSALERLVNKENRILLAVNLIVVFLLIFPLKNSLVVSLFFLAQSLLSYLMFELSNYVQHYGLQRKTTVNGELEPIQYKHSWNYYYRYTNYLTYLVPLHSYHHVHQNDLDNELPYGPTLPYSYFRMMILALVPALWYKKMDVLCERYISA